MQHQFFYHTQQWQQPPPFVDCPLSATFWGRGEEAKQEAETNYAEFEALQRNNDIYDTPRLPDTTMLEVDEDNNYSQSQEKEEESPKFVNRNFSTSSDIIYLSWNESKIQSVKDYFQELIGQLFYCWRSSANSSYDVLFKLGDTQKLKLEDLVNLWALINCRSEFYGSTIWALVYIFYYHETLSNSKQAGVELGLTPGWDS